MEPLPLCFEMIYFSESVATNSSKKVYVCLECVREKVIDVNCQQKNNEALHRRLEIL
jgi:hypothetical protein